MGELKKLLKPQKSELFILFCITLALLFFENFNRYVGLLGCDDRVTSSNSNQFSGYLSDWFLGIEAKIDPRFVDFIAWLVIGAIVFAIVSVFVAMYHSANQEVELLHYYRNPVGRRHEVITFISKTAIRLAAILGILGWLIVFLKYINPTLAAKFFTATTHMASPISWFWLITSTVLFAASMYVFAILARFATLKVRVFGEYLV